MRILLLNQTFFPDVAATAQYASDLAATLVERDHEVTVVCSQRAYDTPGEKYPRRETWRGVEIRRIACTGLGKGARWKRATDFGTYIANCALHLCALPRYDVVLGLTSPPLISWLGALFTRIKGGRFVFWVMDLNPDEAVAAGWLREGSRTERVLQSMLRASLRTSSLVVVLDRFMAQRIEAKGVDAARIATIPPWSQDHAVQYDVAGRERFRRQHGLEGKFVVMYAGNHSPCHPLDTLVEAAAALRNRSDVAFCFVGGGSERETVRGIVEREQLTNVVMVPYQPFAELAASLSAADLHTVVMGDPFVGLVHPSKVHNIRALGIPYLYVGPAESHVTEMMPAYSARHGDVGVVVQHIQMAAGLATAPVGSRARRSEPVVATRDQWLQKLVVALEHTNAAAVPLVERPEPSRSPQS